MRWFGMVLFYPFALALGVLLRVLDRTSRRKHYGQPYPDASALWQAEDRRSATAHPVPPCHVNAPQPTTPPLRLPR